MKSHHNSYPFICLILFLTLLLPSIASAKVQINTTIEDNLVILIDYSGSTLGFRDEIQTHTINSIRSVENDANVSIVVYGGFIKRTELYPMDSQENRSILENFVHNLTGKYGDVAYNNGIKALRRQEKYCTTPLVQNRSSLYQAV
jgi:hypothetical protein